MVGDKAANLTIPLGEELSEGTPAIRPRVFIVSDVRLLCDGLVLALSQQPSLIVVGSADRSASPAYIAEMHPDVLLLDIRTREGCEVLLPFRQNVPDLKIVAIAVADVEQEVFACAEAGVSGFVARDGSIQDVVTAVHCAVRNELVCSPRMAALLVSRIASLAGRRSAAPNGSALTRREHEIVSLVSEGLSNKQIARQLRIQNATVKNHIHSILSKLQLRRRGEVAAQWRGSGSHLAGRTLPGIVGSVARPRGAPGLDPVA
jgi:two-component system nitrate/nitrite response regulator NarL